MSTPTIDPDDREPATIAPTDSYRPAAPVWVFRAGTWRAGIIEAATARAATVTYRINSSRGTGVDTMTARYVLPRGDSPTPSG
jgi:hypothetical protein